MKHRVTRLTTMALLVALAVVLTRVASVRIAVGGIEAVRIGFGSLPIVLAGALMGPIAGGIVGGAEDLLGYFINPVGPYMPHFSLTSALAGLIPGLVLSFRKKELPSIAHIALAVIAGQVIVALGLVPYFLQILFRVPRAASMPGRLVSATIDLLIYTPFIHLMYRHLSKVGLLKRLTLKEDR